MNKNDNDNAPRHERTVGIAVILFFVMAFFGYQIGSDLAHRENARDNVARTAPTTP